VVEQASPHGGGRPWAADACTDWDAASAAPAQTEGGSGTAPETRQGLQSHSVIVGLPYGEL